MNILKNAAVKASAAPISQQELALIQGFTKSPVAAEKLYTFEVLLCDNEVDRDDERFDNEALEALRGLFVGKTGIFDHCWSASKQVARIYSAEVRSVLSVENALGEVYTGLFAKAYMLRGGDNDEIIQSIEGGIRKEVSVSCAVGERVCSVCGEDYGLCPHQKGAVYDGEKCHVTLKSPTDAYEWSFVAVPAQRGAGVVKKFALEEGEMNIRDFLMKNGGQELVTQLEALEKSASLGESYLSSLRGEVIRLGALSGCGISAGTLKTMTDKLEENELLALKKSYEDKVKQAFPVTAQLRRETSAKECGSEEYLI